MVRFLYGVARLLRLPNLFTLPGDVLCGFFLVQIYPAYPLSARLDSPETLVLLLTGSFAVYCFGLIQNDLCGYDEDCRYGRSNRPLVDGSVSLKTARTMLSLTGIVAVVSAVTVNFVALGITVLILLSATCYNFLSPSFPRLSAPLMGLCRSLNVMLGASAFGLEAFSIELLNFPFLICVVFHFCYTSAVTLLASTEEKGRISKFLLLTPFTAALVLAVVIPHLVFAILAVWVLCLSLSLWRAKTPEAIGTGIGQLIGTLILVQLCWVVLVTGDVFLVAIILFLYLGNHTVSKMLYSS